MAQLLYSLFVRLFGYAHDWGIVTGVRPVKLLRRLTEEQGARRRTPSFGNSCWCWTTNAP